jgi:translation initiation factor IF-2
VHFLGRSTDFRQEVQSMQIEHESISEAGKGQEIAMKVERRVRNHDKVYKLSDDE